MTDRIDIKTERLRIRYYTEADLESRYRLAVEAFKSNTTRKAIQNWLSWTTQNYVALADLHQPPYGDYAIEHLASGLVIGSVGIPQAIVPWGVLNGESPDKHHYLVSPEFGLFWGILPEYQRQGYATEAGQAIINYLFQEWSVKQVVATTEFDNIPSQKSMEKLGMTLYRNPTDKPFWCQVVGLLRHPDLRI